MPVKLCGLDISALSHLVTQSMSWEMGQNQVLSHGLFEGTIFIAVPWFLSALLVCNHKHATFLIKEKKKTHKFFKAWKIQPALFLFLCSNTCSIMELLRRLFFPLAAYQFTDIACGYMKSQTHGFSYFVSGFMAISLLYLLNHNMKSEDTEWNLSFIKPANPHKTLFLWILGLCKLALPSFLVCFLDDNPFSDGTEFQRD